MLHSKSKLKSLHLNQLKVKHHIKLKYLTSAIIYIIEFKQFFCRKCCKCMVVLEYFSVHCLWIVLTIYFIELIFTMQHTSPPWWGLFKMRGKNNIHKFGKKKKKNMHKWEDVTTLVQIHAQKWSSDSHRHARWLTSGTAFIFKKENVPTQNLW